MTKKNLEKKVFFMPTEMLEQNLGAFPYSFYHKKNVVKDYDMFLNFIRDNNLCEKNDGSFISISESKLDDIVRDYLSTKNSATYRNLSRCCLKAVFSLHNLEFDRSKYPVTNYTEFKNVESRLVTYDEFVNELNNLFNESEKLISYMAFKGILGEEVLNARMAKVSDVDFEKNIWTLYDGTVIELQDDELLVKLLKNTIAQKEYIPYDKKDKVSQDGLHFPESYLYNPDSEYLFKTRNHPRSGNGLSPFKRVGIETMFARLVHEFGAIFNRNNLKVSGFLDTMYRVDPSPNWTIQRINELKDETPYRISAINARVFYLQKYFPEVLIEKAKAKEKREKLKQEKEARKARKLQNKNEKL